MGARTSISWSNTTWNPLAGCKKVSAGCKNCYAERMANRLAAMAKRKVRNGESPGRLRNYTRTVDPNGRWSGHIHLDWEAINDPYNWRTPRMVFVNSMSDLFHEDVPQEFIDRVFDVMKENPHHTFQILTKRPERINRSLPTDWNSLEYAHVWLGTSVENQRYADERLEHLRMVPTFGRAFVSAEPLLGPINLTNDQLDGLGWVIVGGESGIGFRAMEPEWADAIRDQCEAAGVAFFYKQDAAYHSGISDTPDRWVQQYPHAMRERTKARSKAHG